MSSKYSMQQCISAQFCAKQMSDIWCKNIHAFLRYSNFRAWIFYFDSPCSLCLCLVKFNHLLCVSGASRPIVDYAQSV